MKNDASNHERVAPSSSSLGYHNLRIPILADLELKVYFENAGCAAVFEATNYLLKFLFILSCVLWRNRVLYVRISLKSLFS